MNPSSSPSQTNAIPIVVDSNNNNINNNNNKMMNNNTKYSNYLTKIKQLEQYYHPLPRRNNTTIKFHKEKFTIIMKRLNIMFHNESIHVIPNDDDNDNCIDHRHDVSSSVSYSDNNNDKPKNTFTLHCDKIDRIRFDIMFW